VKLLKKSEQLKKTYDDNKLDREHEKAIADKEAKEKAANGASQEDDDDDEDALEIQEVPDEEDVDTADSDDDDMDLAMISQNIMDDAPVDLSDSESEAEVEGEEIEDDGEEYEDGEEGEEEEEDDEYDSDSDDDYITPIDRVDELVYFASKVNALYTNENQVFQGLLGGLNPDDRKELESLVEASKTREIENAKKEQERLQRVALKRAGKKN